MTNIGGAIQTPWGHDTTNLPSPTSISGAAAMAGSDACHSAFSRVSAEARHSFGNRFRLGLQSLGEIADESLE
ncbi:MAG: hypothetical protein R2843_05585 [Thermomicrobiales bacterium]